MSVYSQALEELVLSGKVGLKHGTSASTYYRYAREINTMCAREGANKRCVAVPKEETIYLI